MEKTFKLKMVEMPNFICIEMPAWQRQYGFNTDAANIPVSSMSIQEATEYAEEMKQAFIDHWRAKQSIPK